MGFVLCGCEWWVARNRSVHVRRGSLFVAFIGVLLAESRASRPSDIPWALEGNTVHSSRDYRFG